MSFGAKIVPMELRHCALEALQADEPLHKVSLVKQIWLDRATLVTDRTRELSPAQGSVPGRPQKPELINARGMPKRSAFNTEGLATLVHAVCHIEFNAINLALDALWRYPNMPQRYYDDWLKVAYEESTHFELLRELLESLGYHYGSFQAHDGLWDMCTKTAHSVTARMALVPRTLEARGLDVTPVIQKKLQSAGSPDAKRATEILDIILRDEVGHVAIGNYWFNWLCDEQGVEPTQYYAELAREHKAPKPRPPFNLEARQRAGFTQQELKALEIAGQ